MLATIMSCKKNEECNLPINEDPKVDCNYENFSTDDYDFIWSDLNTEPSPTGPHFTPNAEFFYTTPVFNPLNEMEIAYVRFTWPPLLDKELWVFNFCTGESQMIANNFNYDLDWGTNGWLLYTGSGGQSCKIKPDGDSLTVMNSNYFVSETGRWNPSGTAFWRKGNNFTEYVFSNGEAYYINTTVPFGVSDVAGILFIW